MRNLLKFIQQYSNFLIFVGLEVAAFLLFAMTQPYQQMRMLSSANVVIAGINQQVREWTDFVSLRKVNNQLAEKNARLEQELMALRDQLERSNERDTSRYYYAHLQWDFIPAKVVDLQTASQHNYLVLNKGSRDHVKEGQGVLGQHGVVGVVSKVNSNFSLVIPLIHPKMNLSCRIQKNGQQGFLHWEGASYRYASLDDVGRHVQVEEGDTIVTSGLTSRFPENILVGVVDKVRLSEGDANYQLRVKLATDYRGLKYVQIINNQNGLLQDILTHDVP